LVFSLLPTKSNNIFLLLNKGMSPYVLTFESTSLKPYASQPRRENGERRGLSNEKQTRSDFKKIMILRLPELSDRKRITEGNAS